jgi:hypothetical protein
MALQNLRRHVHAVFVQWK